jgi:Domain of unknown function (DUF4440)
MRSYGQANDGLCHTESRIGYMKSNSRSIHLHLMLIGLIWSSSLIAAEPNPERQADTARLRELKEVLWPKAYREQDAALLAQILADEFESIDAEGNRSTKAEELDYVRKNKPSYDSFRFVIRRLQIFENRTAVVSGTGYIETKAKDGKKGSKTEYQSSNVLIERDGRWQAISSHVSGIKTSES